MGRHIFWNHFLLIHWINLWYPIHHIVTRIVFYRDLVLFRLDYALCSILDQPSQQILAEFKVSPWYKHRHLLSAIEIVPQIASGNHNAVAADDSIAVENDSGNCTELNSPRNVTQIMDNDVQKTKPELIQATGIDKVNSAARFCDLSPFGLLLRGLWCRSFEILKLLWCRSFGVFKNLATFCSNFLAALKKRVSFITFIT